MYDLCLLITYKDQNQNRFGVVRIQIDDTIILSNKEFTDLEEKELIFIAKPREELRTNKLLVFNGYILAKDENNLTIKQKGQAKRIKLIPKGNKEQYV